MFSKKNLFILVILFVFWLLWMIFLNSTEEQKQGTLSLAEQEQGQKLEEKSNTPKCKWKEVEYRVNGNSMEPLLLHGSKLKVQEGYYTCGGKIERWDIVIYQSVATKDEIIKIVRVVPGDTLTLDEKAWTLKIAGEIMKNSQGEIYYFNTNECRFLSLYILQGKRTGDELTGKMQEGAYFIFGDNTTNSIDSRKIGAVGRDGFIGKVMSTSKIRER